MTKKEEALFQSRLERHLDELRWLYMELYDNGSMFAELCETCTGSPRSGPLPSRPGTSPGRQTPTGTNPAI